MFAGRGSAFVVTTTAMSRELICFTETTCSPAAECNDFTLAVRAGAAKAGTATSRAEAETAAIRRLMRIPQRSPPAVPFPAPLSATFSTSVEPGGDEPVRDRRGRRQQGPAGA